jgi:hypothetical protein
MVPVWYISRALAHVLVLRKPALLLKMFTFLVRDHMDASQEELTAGGPPVYHWCVTGIHRATTFFSLPPKEGFL